MFMSCALQRHGLPKFAAVGILIVLYSGEY
jgi:hypothetical protein